MTTYYTKESLLAALDNNHCLTDTIWIPFEEILPPNDTDITSEEARDNLEHTLAYLLAGGFEWGLENLSYKLVAASNDRDGSQAILEVTAHINNDLWTEINNN